MKQILMNAVTAPVAPMAAAWNRPTGTNVFVIMIMLEKIVTLIVLKYSTDEINS